MTTARVGRSDPSDREHTLSETILRELALSARSVTRSGRSIGTSFRRHALERAARTIGWDGNVDIDQWLRDRYPLPPRAAPNQATVEHVTTEIMRQWIALAPMRGQVRTVARKRLERPLGAVAHAHGRCEGKPLGLWLLEHSRTGTLEERKATAEAVRLMSASAPMADELATVVCGQLSDRNRLVRTAASAVAALLAPRVSERLAQTLRDALVECLKECAQGVDAPSRLALPPNRASELEVYAEELGGNHPDACAWTAAACALSAHPSLLSANAVIEELRRGLSSPHWMVRVVAADVISRAGQSRIEAARAGDMTRAPDGSTRQAGLRRLSALAEASDLPAESVSALRAAILTGDPGSRAAALWAVATVARRGGEFADPIREMLRRAALSPAWPLRPVAEAALDASRAAPRMNLVEGFLRYAGRLGESVQRVSLPEEMVRSGRTEADSPAACLYIAYDWHDHSEPGAEALRARLEVVEQTVRSSQPVASILAHGDVFGGVETLRDGPAIAVLFFGEVKAALRCAEEVSRALFPIHPLRVSLHAGTDLALARQVSGDWALEGALLAGAREVAALAQPREIVVSDHAARPLCDDPALTRRLLARDRVTVTGAVDMPIYLLEAPAPAGVTTFVLPRERRWWEPPVLFVRRLLRPAAALGLAALLGLGAWQYGPSLKLKLDRYLGISTRQPSEASAVGVKLSSGSSSLSQTDSAIRGGLGSMDRGRTAADDRSQVDLPDGAAGDPAIAGSAVQDAGLSEGIGSGDSQTDEGSLEITESSTAGSSSARTSGPSKTPSSSATVSIKALVNARGLRGTPTTQPRPPDGSRYDGGVESVSVQIQISGGSEILGVCGWDSTNNQFDLPPGTRAASQDVFGKWLIIQVTVRDGKDPVAMKFTLPPPSPDR